MNDYSKLVKEYRELFESTDVTDIQRILLIGRNLYDAMLNQYDYAYSEDNIPQQVRLCDIAKTVSMKMEKSFYHVKSDEDKKEIIKLYRKCFALSARRDLRQFALYIESGKRKKVWAKTMRTMESAFYYASKFLSDNDFNLLRLSCQPGLGKSYFGNLLVAQVLGNDPNMSILRITFSDDLVESTTKQTKAIICSKEFREIFPRYADVLDKDMFKVDKNNMFALFDCEDETSFNAVTRDGQATGKRAKLVIIDDLLKGQIESNNSNLQLQLIDRYDSDWSSRADDDKQKTLLLGTMWANLDLLNVLYDRMCEETDMIPSKLFKFTELNIVKNKILSCFIGIPAIDPDTGQSTCPDRFSTEYLLKKKKNMSEYLWSAVYMQNPIAPEGLEFTWSQLSTYEVFPKDKPLRVYASLDPARRGKNYVAMPIFYQFQFNEDKWYLADFLYRKKSMKELYDSIVDKIIEHRINQLVVENNTDTSLKEVLETRLRQKNYYNCTITEIYSYQNKEQRINDNQGDVRNVLVFPKKNLYPDNTEIGKAMQSITSFSFMYPNKFDDAIDSTVLFIQKFVTRNLTVPSIGTFNRNALGI